jgi:cytochrome c-type biogenesis protein CcmF
MYRLTYQDMSLYPATNMTKLVASMVVERDGRRVGILTPDQRAYRQRGEISTEVGIRRVWNEDLYVILAGIDDPNSPTPLATFRVLVNPLVPWIWMGGVIMAIGTLVAMWPSAPGPVPVPVLPSRASPAARPERKRELAEV